MKSIEFENAIIPGLVSIVMPARNADKYIGATLATIGEQTYSKWELIVVDDGSMGKTQQIVDQFARASQSPVKYFRNDRSFGAGYTRNIAFAKSSGEYVALLDSDDRWHSDHLALSVMNLQKTFKDIVYSTVQMVADGSDEEIGVWGPTDVELTEFPQSIFGRSFVTPSATVMRRQVLETVGAWSTTHRYCEDYDYWLRCIAVKVSFHHIEGIHCLYRKNHQGATTQKLCGLLEEVAITTERYFRMPGLAREVCRDYAVNAHKLAADFHRKSDPALDPSADPARAGRILLRAWRVQPKRIELLLEGMKLLASENLRRDRVASDIPPPSPFKKTRPTQNWQPRAAA
ncbi:MAG: glycosyltransferase family 2 protein [Pirellulaceae bacterium]|nr:glycosyltransferase family 2 protein [Pirellulaceae bacterium]